jgi:hypothetical protein
MGTPTRGIVSAHVRTHVLRAIHSRRIKADTANRPARSYTTGAFFSPAGTESKMEGPFCAVLTLVLRVLVRRFPTIS